MKRALFVIALIALAVVWAEKKLSGERMARDLAQMHQQQRELSVLLRERDRLRHRLSDATATPLREKANAVMAPNESRSHISLPPALPLGDWLAARTWRFRGQTTPRATIETALWAAAGGDVAALKQLLTVSDPARAAATDLLDSLPAAARSSYREPDDLIAALTVKSIPLGEAQLVWLNQNGPDTATACLFLKDPLKPIAPTNVQATPDEPGIPPPQLPADNQTVTAYLSLHREDGRWRLVVPPAAVEKMARELAPAPKSGS